MEENFRFSKAVVVEEMVELADDDVGTLPAVTGFICKIIDLPWDPFTMNSKNRAFPSNQEVHRTRLQRIRGVMDLLKGKIQFMYHF